MKDPSKARLANMAARFGTRIRAADDAKKLDRESFDQAFLGLADTIIEPAMREVGEEVRRLGFDFAIERTARDASEGPGIALRLHLSARVPKGHPVAFVVIERDPRKGSEILAYLEASPPRMDLARYQPDKITAGVVEQLLVDSVEQIFSCVAEL